MSGDRGSVSGVLVCWSLDLGSTPDGSLSFSFPPDHLGLSMLTTKLNKIYIVYIDLITMLIIGVLHFIITPISTFCEAFVSEIW